jgi:hypothetical protein
MSNPAMPTVAQKPAMNATAISTAPKSEPCANAAPAIAGNSASVRANT